MTVDFQIIPMPNDDEVLTTVASWSIKQWGADFPEDSADTYVRLYVESITSSAGIPRVFVALNAQKQPVATITFVADDDLPDATEPGPWLAALLVLPEYRQQGLGRSLVRAVVEHARSLRYSTLYLYTPDQVQWYERMGWSVVREARLSDHKVTVMALVL